MGIAFLNCQLSKRDALHKAKINDDWISLFFNLHFHSFITLFIYLFLFSVLYLQTDVKRKSNIWLDPLGLVLVPCLWWVSKGLCEPWKKLWLSTIYRHQLSYTFYWGPFCCGRILNNLIFFFLFFVFVS